MSLTQNSLITRPNSQGKFIVPSRTHHNGRPGMNFDLDAWSFFLEQEQGEPSSAIFTVEWEWATHWPVVLKFPSQKSVPLSSSTLLMVEKQQQQQQNAWGLLIELQGQSQGHSSLKEDVLPWVARFYSSHLSLYHQDLFSCLIFVHWKDPEVGFRGDDAQGEGTQGTPERCGGHCLLCHFQVLLKWGQ